MFRFRALRLILPALALFSLSCAGEYPGADELGSREQATICGPTDDMQHVELYNGSLGVSTTFVGLHQAPVGNIRWKSDLSSRYTNPGDVNGVRWCTATLVSANTMVTAGHCFDPDGGGWTWPRVNGTSNPVSAAQGALEMNVEFGYQLDPFGNPRTPTVITVTGLSEYRLGGLDYAVITVAGSPGTTFGTTTVTPFPMYVNNQIAIIQHPNGERKQVHSGPIASVGTSTMTYATADTEGGSSGSGVLNPATGMIHGVHVAGGCTAAGGANNGVPMSAIYGASPILRALSFDAAKYSVIVAAL